MAATNADDSTGVAVETFNALDSMGALETSDAEENDICDLENEIDYPSQAEVDVASVVYPSWDIDARNVESSYVARMESRATNALLRRLKTSTLYDDDDDGNDAQEEDARDDLIRRSKTPRLVERRKQDSEAKNSFAAPSNPLPLNRHLSNRHDFLRFRISS